jgi:hypothetical protein
MRDGQEEESVKTWASDEAELHSDHSQQQRRKRLAKREREPEDDPPEQNKKSKQGL